MPHVTIIQTVITPVEHVPTVYGADGQVVSGYPDQYAFPRDVTSPAHDREAVIKRAVMIRDFNAALNGE